VGQRRSALAVLLGALALAFALNGCGGERDETQSRAQSTVAQSEQTGPPKSAPRSLEAAKPAKQKSAGRRDSGKSRGSKANAAPLEVSGGGSEQFKAKGGDNSVQEYGSEAEETELREAAELVHSFYVARIAEEWGRVCSYLSKHALESFEQLAAQTPQLKGKGCAPILAALSEPLSPPLQRATTTVDAHALRHEGSQAFLIYTGPPGETIYSMPLSTEGGVWKVGALSGSALPGA
jgi:hypothetical protein